MQAKKIFDSLTCYGQSKFVTKQKAKEEWKNSDKTLSMAEYVNNAIRDKIYSYKTYYTYAQHNNYFIEWVEANHPYKDRKTIEQIRQYVPDWLNLRKKQNLSPYTLKLEISALAKLYQCSTKDFGVDLPKRERQNITRSRNRVESDKHFSLTKNAEIINFCRGTGLRRSELQALKGSQLLEDEDGTYSLKIKGKGGKIRYAPIIGPHTEEIVERIKKAGNDLVWPSVPSHMDIHSYRAEYATIIYLGCARPLSDIPKNELYFCRSDRKGVCFDKKAMLIASRALGHNRISVVGEHYLRFE